MRRAMLCWGRSLAVGPILLIGTAAFGDGPPATAGERWDDSHMRSNFARRLEGPVPKREIRGADRFRELADHTAPAPATGVPETILSISPHEWQPGYSGRGGNVDGPPYGTSSSASSGGSGHPSRGSGLRSSSLSNARHRR
jgi:hypothetical protein